MDLVLAVASQRPGSSQCYYRIPLWITAVTDPVVAGLAESLNGLVATSAAPLDMNPVEEQVALVKVPA